MSKAFRKSLSKRAPAISTGAVTVNNSLEVVTKEVKEKGASEPTTYVEVKMVNISDSSLVKQMPKDSDYLLRDMIKAGQIPEEVPVHGMLNSQDPTDLSNQGVPEAILDRLSVEVSSEPQKSASEPVSTPEPTPTPSE